MAEEAAARRVDAIGPAAEIDAVQIQLQDLLLAELAFHRHGEDDLAELAGEFARVREEDVAGKLLRDGGRAMRSEEHTSELQSIMSISSAVFCFKKNKIKK